MNLSGEHLLADLNQRGLIAQYSGDQELASHLDQPRELFTVGLTPRQTVCISAVWCHYWSYGGFRERGINRLF